jgi:peptidoglycan hydrolase-like protein with peptidoglycan-binding domain
MKKLIISSTLCAVLVLGAGVAHAETASTTTTTTSTSSMLAKIQELMKLIAELQAKLTAARGEIKDLMKGAEGAEVKEIQELLASDPSIFGVKPTGYYGPLTEEAIKKFQARYGLPVTGIVDEATREVMRELKMEKKNGIIPPGLVKSDEVKARIKARLQAKWGDCVWGPKFRASDCKKGHDNASSTDATRAEALAAIEDANEAIADLVDEIEEMEEDDADEENIEDAEDRLADAKKKLSDARRALARGDYDDAVEKAESAVEKATGEVDDEDDDEDDEDEDDEDEDDE